MKIEYNNYPVTHYLIYLALNQSCTVHCGSGGELVSINRLVQDELHLENK